MANRRRYPRIGRRIDISGQALDDQPMATRSTAALILLVDSLQRLGHDVAPVLKRFGIDARHLDPTAAVERELELRVNEAIAESLGDPLAGLEVGRSLGIGSYGPFTLLLLTCDDAASAARTAVRYQSLAFLFGRLSFEPGRHESSLVLEPPPLTGKALRFRVDLEVAGVWKMIHDLHRTAHSRARPERIAMPYARPAEAAAYERAFGCRVEWDRRTARFAIGNSAWQERFATADSGAHRLIRAQCDRLVAELGTIREGMAARVRAHLAACLQDPPTAMEAAAALGTSERSLRRALAAEGTSFRLLLDEIRRRRADELLFGERLPVESVALRLGYSEPAAFIHAYRRWTGTTPAAARRGTRRTVSE